MLNVLKLAENNEMKRGNKKKDHELRRSMNVGNEMKVRKIK